MTSHLFIFSLCTPCGFRWTSVNLQQHAEGICFTKFPSLSTHRQAAAVGLIVDYWMGRAVGIYSLFAHILPPTIPEGLLVCLFFDNPAKNNYRLAIPVNFRSLDCFLHI